MKSPQELRDAIAEQERDLKSLRDKLELAEKDERIERQMALRPLAEKCHDLFCQYNHTDGCSWGYEGNNWEGWAHRRWLDRIETLTSQDPQTVNVETLQNILEKVAQLKQEYSNAIYLVDQLRRG